MWSMIVYWFNHDNFVQNISYVPLQYCAEHCVSQQSQTIAQEFIRGLDGWIGFTDLLQNHIIPLLSCDVVTTTFYDMQDVICVSLV